MADFYAKYYDESQKLSLAQKRIFRESRKIAKEKGANSEDSATVEPEQQSELSKLFAAPQPPELPKMLPKLVMSVTSQTPDIYKATVAQAMFPSLATYPRKLAFT